MIHHSHHLVVIYLYSYHNLMIYYMFLIYRMFVVFFFFFFSSRRRHTRFDCDWSSDVCSSDLPGAGVTDRSIRRPRKASADSRDRKAAAGRRGHKAATGRRDVWAGWRWFQTPRGMVRRAAVCFAASMPRSCLHRGSARRTAARHPACTPSVVPSFPDNLATTPHFEQPCRKQAISQGL